MNSTNFSKFKIQFDISPNEIEINALFKITNHPRTLA